MGFVNELLQRATLSVILNAGIMAVLGFAIRDFEASGLISFEALIFLIVLIALSSGLRVFDKYFPPPRTLDGNKPVVTPTPPRDEVKTT